jgi:hypothetical protein
LDLGDLLWNLSKKAGIEWDLSELLATLTARACPRLGIAFELMEAFFRSTHVLHGYFTKAVKKYRIAL